MIRRLPFVGIMLIAENRECHPPGGPAMALDQDPVGLLVACRRLASQRAVTCVPITHQPPQTLSGAPVRSRGPAVPMVAGIRRRRGRATARAAGARR